MHCSMGLRTYPGLQPKVASPSSHHEAPTTSPSQQAIPWGRQVLGLGPPSPGLGSLGGAQETMVTSREPTGQASPPSSHSHCTTWSPEQQSMPGGGWHDRFWHPHPQESRKPCEPMGQPTSMAVQSFGE
jgi:hypothetical protein